MKVRVGMMCRIRRWLPARASYPLATLEVAHGRLTVTPPRIAFFMKTYEMPIGDITVSDAPVNNLMLKPDVDGMRDLRVFVPNRAELRSKLADAGAKVV